MLFSSGMYYIQRNVLITVKVCPNFLKSSFGIFKNIWIKHLFKRSWGSVGRTNWNKNLRLLSVSSLCESFRNTLKKQPILFYSLLKYKINLILWINFVVGFSSYQYLNICIIYSSIFIYWKNCISVQWETLYYSIQFGNLILNFQIKLNVFVIVKLKNH